MKKLALILSFFWLMFEAKAQTCQEVFVSEVVFSKDSTQTLLGSSTTWIENYALELYNPTTADIDLSLYSIHLIPQTGNPTILTLTDSIEAEATYVISKLGADYDLTSVAELITNSLDYDNFVAIELYKNNTLVDRVGQTGLTIPDNIDLAQAIADPANYLSSLNIDLSSIEQLIFRRNPMIGEGNPDFDSLSKEWYVVPNADYSDVHHHTNICKETDIIVEFEQENYITTEGTAIFPNVKVYNYDPQIAPTLNILIEKKVVMPYTAVINPFYVDNYDHITPNYAILQFPFTSYDVNSASDNLFEPDEIVMYEIKSVSTGKINPAKKYTSILFHNQSILGIETDVLEKIFQIYPNPTNSQISIKAKDNQKITNVLIYNNIGEKVFESNSHTNSIDMSFLPNGQYCITIFTEGEVETQIITKY